MKAWLLARYASSTFNTCPHRVLPCMAGPPVEIHVDPKATPKACHKPASIPVHWQQNVHEDLLRDEALGVVERVPYGEPVTWCHRMVVTRKHDGSPRRTVDLSPLNKFCHRVTIPPSATHPKEHMEDGHGCLERIPQRPAASIRSPSHHLHHALRTLALHQGTTRFPILRRRLQSSLQCHPLGV